MDKNETQHNELEEMDMSNDNDSSGGGGRDESRISGGGDEGEGMDFDDQVELNPDDFDVDSDDDDEDTRGEFVQQSKPQQTVPDSDFGDFSFAGGETGNFENTECSNSLTAEVERWVSRDGCNTAIVSGQKQFVCVKYPAIIRNKDKALASLGGFDNIFEARDNGKLDLKFRPDDPYCKPTVGLYKKNNHLLVRCRRRKAKDNRPSTSRETDESHDGYEYKVEVIGVVNGIFTFDRPCDFQYLPIIKKAETDGGGYHELLSDIVIKFEDDRQDFINRDVPLFLPPYVFSRAEKPAKYVFQDDETKGDQEFIGMSRKMRPRGTQRANYTSTEIPQKPNRNAIASFGLSNVNLDPLKELFKERPLWSRVGIASRLKKIGHINLQKYVNMVAYYFGSGPWLHLWCKFGYDPRKDPKSKHYQTVDFRIRKVWNREKVTAKRGSDHFLGQRRQGLNTVKGHRLPPMGQMAGQNGANTGDIPSTSTAKEQEIDVHYQFCANRMPPYRQMYYQLCDVFDDKIQEMAHTNDGQETECTERDGWCIPDFLALSRDIMAEHAENLLMVNREDAMNEEQQVEIT